MGTGFFSHSEQARRRRRKSWGGTGIRRTRRESRPPQTQGVGIRPERVPRDGSGKGKDGGQGDGTTWWGRGRRGWRCNKGLAAGVRWWCRELASGRGRGACGFGSVAPHLFAWEVLQAEDRAWPGEHVGVEGDAGLSSRRIAARLGLRLELAPGSGWCEQGNCGGLAVGLGRGSPPPKQSGATVPGEGVSREGRAPSLTGRERGRRSGPLW